MRNYTSISIIICFLLSLNLLSCRDDTTAAGSAALLEEESVIVRSDTLRDVTSGNIEASPAYNEPDSLLLGECKSEKYGTLKADFLTQLACPEGWVFPDSSELDSVCLYIYYRSWHGNGNAPLGITAYALDGEQLAYDSLYASDTDIKRFCSLHDSLRLFNNDFIVSAGNNKDSIYSETYTSHIPFIRIRLNDKWAKHLFSLKQYSSQAAFNNHFRGIYLTSSFGGETVLYVNSLCMTIHYHYTFPSSDSQNGYKTLSDNKVLYANTEVRKIQRYIYTNRDDVFKQLESDKNSNYILSPTNIYTLLKIPTQTILDSINSGVKQRKHTYVNMARLQIDVVRSTSSDAWAKPASTMMMVREEEFDKVFRLGMMPEDTAALISNLTSYYNSDSAAYLQYYSFNMQPLFNNMLRGAHPDTLRLLLLPVDVTYSSSSTTSAITAIKLNQAVTATHIYSSASASSPMDIEVVYSGFTDTRIGGQ